MKKLKFLMWGLIFYLGTLSSIAQNGYHYKFRGSNADEYCAASSVINGIYYTVGNTKSSASSNSNRILLCKYDVSGLLWCRDLYDANNPTHEYYATDIQAGYSSITPSDDTLPNTAPDPDAPGPSMNPIAAQNSNDYLYISGYIKVPSSSVDKMLLLKVNGNGNIIWGRTDFNQNDNNIDEIGVSVESAPNGGAFIVGRSRNVTSGTIYVSVARFDGVGNRRWFNRYTNNGNPNGTYIPKQSCIFEEMVTTSPSGIAITGEYGSSSSTVSKSFVMRINHGGIENWRLICPSLVTENGDSLGDAGWDIVTDPNTTVGQVTTVNNFVVTGCIGNPAALPRYMYLFRANIFGTFTNGFKIGVFGSPEYIFGESVIHAALNNSTDVVVAGEMKHASTTELSTYAMKISPVTGTVGWSVYYPLTQPDQGATESVVENGGGAGYFIATNELTIGNKDAVAILTNNVGKVNKDCESVDFSTSVTNVGTGYSVSPQRYTEAKSEAVSTTREDISGTDQVCKLLPLPPFNCTCLPSPLYNYCCCLDTFIKYRVCLRFDTAACWPMRNWTITTWFGDSTPGVPISGSNSICHTYRRGGTYVACFEIFGQVFYGGAWVNCRSITKCFVITIDTLTGCMTGSPPCSTAYCPPAFKNVPASIEDEVKEPYELKVYPNPLDRYKDAELAFMLPESGHVQIEMMDISGRLIWREQKMFEAGKQKLALPTSNIGNGVYLIHFRTPESVKVLKLDIRR